MEAGKAPFVLVHGAWHGGWCWRAVGGLLRAAGHEVFAPSLTGLGDRAHLFAAGIPLATHVQDICALIEAESLDGCVLVGHSYGGNVITGVGDRLRARVRHYVYLDAVVPPDDVRSWRWSDFNDADQRRSRLAAIAGAGAGVCLPAPAPEAFGVPPGPLAQWLGARLRPMPAATYTEPLQLGAGGTGGLPRTYVAAIDPVYAPMAPVHAALRSRDGWDFAEIGGGHDVMLTQPRRLAELLLRIAAG